MSDNELGTFLRSRREALTPAEVGLPAGSRRRTPGLRRAELATLAGVSVEYLTRLEQGRHRRPSPEVLSTLVRALRLSEEESRYLMVLAKSAGGGRCAGGGETPAETPAETVRPTVRALLAQLEPSPAAVVSRCGDLLAVSTGFEHLAGPVGLLRARLPNLARFVFTDPRAPAVFPDWGEIADQQVMVLKASAICEDRHAAALTEQLTSVGAAFTERWRTAAGPPARTGIQRWVHPEVGELRLAYELLELAGGEDQSLLVYLPADEASVAALDRLTGRRPGALAVAA